MSEREKQKPEEKVKIVIKYIAGEVSISGAATEAGVDRKTLQRWVMQYEAEGERPSCRAGGSTYTVRN